MLICKKFRSFVRKRLLWKRDCCWIWRYGQKLATDLCFYKKFLIPGWGISPNHRGWYVPFSPSRYLLRWILGFPVRFCCIFCRWFRSNWLMIFCKDRPEWRRRSCSLGLWRTGCFRILALSGVSGSTQCSCLEGAFLSRPLFLGRLYISTRVWRFWTIRRVGPDRTRT